MKERVIGVLGGMGPEATLAFYSWILRLTPAERDQDHLRVLIDSNPRIPDRTAALLHGGPSPVPAIREGIAALRRAGADFVVIPCVSAHAFLEEIRAAAELPIVSLFDVTAEAIRTRHPGIRRLGLLATTGTIRAGALQRRLAREGLETLVPPAEGQEIVMRTIYGVKAAAGEADRGRLREAVRAVADRLLSAGAEGVIAGCTEIPLVLGAGDLPVPFFDTLRLLAEAAVSAAGRTPRADVP
ncbi:MAG: amino acid racemase [Desulfobacterales bacterium]